MTRWVFCLVFCASAVVLGAVATVADHSQDSQTVFERDVELVNFQDLEYPRIAHSARIQGLVVLTVTLNPEGDVLSAAALAGAPVLIGPAIENVKKWKFRSKRQRRAVIVYNFSLEPAVCPDRYRSYFLLEHWNYVSIRGCPATLQTAAGDK